MAQEQPIETAPKEDELEILLFIPFLGWRPAYWGWSIGDKRGYCWRSPVRIAETYTEATHWMPMPPAPSLAPTKCEEK
jgi:hypothetical protein